MSQPAPHVTRSAQAEPVPVAFPGPSRPGAAEDHEVVAVHDLPVVPGPLPGGKPTGGPAHQRGDLGRVVVDQAARDHLAIGP